MDRRPPPPATAAALCWALGGCAVEEKADEGPPLPTRADLTSADAIGAACERAERSRSATTVRFPGDGGSCPFGEGDNDERDNGEVTARREEEVRLPLPADAVLCGVTLDFAAEGSSGWDAGLRYDDAFFFTLSDAVLVGSDAALVAALPRDGVVPIYAWPAVRGAPLEFTDVEPWCLGEAEGLSDCDVPQPERGGLMALSFAQALVNELSYQALDRGPLRFGMVTVGDNDDSDCRHDPLTFEVSAEWMRAG